LEVWPGIYTKEEALLELILERILEIIMERMLGKVQEVSQ
jgi:hypothetical protein